MVYKLISIVEGMTFVINCFEIGS